MNILEVQDLCKTYGTGETEVHALNHVSFSVRKGEFIAIIGESGSGKSTLLNVVGALDSATSGRVWIDGQDIFSMPEKKLTVFRRQQQRVAIGRALVTRPALIMADEPTGNLDSKNSQEVLALLQTMSDRYQQTILMITHNKNHASAADRVFRMSDGVLKDLGVSSR